MSDGRRADRAVPVRAQRRAQPDGARLVQHLAGDRAVAWSGGSEPGDEVNPAAVAAMAEVGIDIAQRVPEAVDRRDRAAPPTSSSRWAAATRARYYPGKRYEDWELDDPAGQGVEAVRPIRDEIERRVRELLGSLAVTPA